MQCQRCRILFFPWKRYWATHSLLFETCGIFFFPDPEKKNTVQKFQIIKVWASEPWWTPTKMIKKWSYALHFRKNTNSHHVIGFFCHENGYRGFTMRIFFFRESWEREKKNTAIFTHSLLFWDFHPKSIFSREIKKYDTFAPPPPPTQCCVTLQKMVGGERRRAALRLDISSAQMKTRYISI